eukprot:2342440-Pleurochrysis_carterae.AAC.1
MTNLNRFLIAGQESHLADMPTLDRDAQWEDRTTTKLYESNRRPASPAEACSRVRTRLLQFARPLLSLLLPLLRQMRLALRRAHLRTRGGHLLLLRARPRTLNAPAQQLSLGCRARLNQRGKLQPRRVLSPLGCTQLLGQPLRLKFELRALSRHRLHPPIRVGIARKDAAQDAMFKVVEQTLRHCRFLLVSLAAQSHETRHSRPESFRSPKQTRDTG